MGTYVYAVRRQFGDATLPDGQTVRLWLLKYLYKPSYSRPAVNRPYQALISRLHNAFENAGVKPEYVAWVDEKAAEGDQVRQWPGLISCHDGGEIPGKIVGYLKRIGRKWSVVTDNPARSTFDNKVLETSVCA